MTLSKREGGWGFIVENSVMQGCFGRESDVSVMSLACSVRDWDNLWETAMSKYKVLGAGGFT